MVYKKSDSPPTLPFSPDSDWGKCVTAFLQSIYDKSGSQSSYAHYKGILMDFLSSVHTTPDLISRDELERYLCSPSKANGREGPVKYGTRNNRLAVIRSLFRFSAEYAVIDEQGMPQPLLRRLAPTAGIRFVQREKPPHRSLSEEQLAAFLAQHAHQLNAHLVFLWLNEGEGRQMALNGNGRIGERQNPICLICLCVNPNMQQWFVPSLGWREKREDLDLAPILPAFPIHGNIEVAIAIFPDQDLPVQVVRFIDEIRSFLNAPDFLRHLTVCLSEKNTSSHRTQYMR